MRRQVHAAPRRILVLAGRWGCDRPVARKWRASNPITVCVTGTPPLAVCLTSPRIEGAQFRAHRAEILSEPVDRGRERSGDLLVAGVERSDSLIERDENEQQALLAMAQP